MNVIGLDLSLTATGVSDGESLAYTLKPAGMDGHTRLSYILGAIHAACRTYSPHLAVVEGISFGSPDTNRAGAGLWHLVTHQLWTEAIPYAVVPPTNRMLYATGKGQADKDAVLAAVIRRWPDYTGADNNTADAWVLACMGRDHLGLPGVTMPATHRRALDKIVWPDRPEEQQ